MLSVQDLRNLLVLISSERLSLNGAEAAGVAVLQQKLQQALAAVGKPIEKAESEKQTNPEKAKSSAKRA